MGLASRVHTERNDYFESLEALSSLNPELGSIPEATLEEILVGSGCRETDGSGVGWGRGQRAAPTRLSGAGSLR